MLLWEQRMTGGNCYSNATWQTKPKKKKGGRGGGEIIRRKFAIVMQFAIIKSHAVQFRATIKMRVAVFNLNLSFSPRSLSFLIRWSPSGCQN